MKEPTPILPGAILGVMGSGQLGRMFAIAARRLGYRVHTFSPEYDTPTGQVADHEVTASYDDEAAVRSFARGVAVLTFEFENVPSQTVAWAADHGGRVAPYCAGPSAAAAAPLAAAGLSVPASASVSAVTPASANASALSSAGNSSQVSCSAGV